MKQQKYFGPLDPFKFSLNSQYGWGTRAILTMGDFQLTHHERFPLTIQCHMVSLIVAIHIVSTLLQLVAITYNVASSTLEIMINMDTRSYVTIGY
jgi:hypothetical protein